MKDNMHYISLYFFEKIMHLLEERIDTLNQVIESVNNDIENNVDNMGVLMSTSLYLKKISKKEKKQELKNTETYKEILNKIKKIKNQIEQIKKYMIMDDKVLFLILYFYIIKNENSHLNYFYKQKKIEDIVIYDIFCEKKTKYNSLRMTNLFIEYIDKYKDVFMFFDENKESLRFILEEKINLNILYSYMACTNKSFNVFNFEIKKDKNISYKDVFVKIIENTRIFC